MFFKYNSVIYCFLYFSSQSCQKQIERYKPAYTTLCKVGNSLLQKSHGNVAKDVSELMQNLDDTWKSLQDEGTRKVTSLRNMLEAWEEYTGKMEVHMTWLRETEKIVRRSFVELTRKDLQEELVKCQVFIFSHLPIFKISIAL